MIASIIIIALAFIWLGVETDGLTVRLLAGKEKPPITPCTKGQIRLLRSRFFNNGFRKTIKAWGSYIALSVADPLCGWEYIRDYGELQPEYTMEVVAYGVTNRITLKSPDTKMLKDIARSMLHKTKLKS